MILAYLAPPVMNVDTLGYPACKFDSPVMITGVFGFFSDRYMHVWSAAMNNGIFDSPLR